MPIRKTVLAAFAAAVGVGVASSGLAKPIMIYDDDDTHCYGSPERVTREGFAAYLDTVCRGPVTHFFTCANAQTAIFDSKVYDPAWRHMDPANPIEYAARLKRLADEGKDPIRMCIGLCRERGISPWVTMRMNDVHGVDQFDNPLCSDFWRTHSDCWVDPETGNPATNVCRGWSFRALDYSKKPVYDYNLAFVRELVDRYHAADGIEIDWMRGPLSLRRGKTFELGHVLTAFMRDVKAAADESGARHGRKLGVAVRVPTDLWIAHSYGMEVEDWVREGLVNIVIPCNYNACSDFLLPYAKIRRTLTAANPAVRVVAGTDSGLYMHEWSPKDPYPRRLLTRAEYYGWADSMRFDGAEDFFLMNLWENPSDSDTWNDILSKGFSSDVLAAATRRYAVTWKEPPGIRPTYGSPLPAEVEKGVCLSVRVNTPSREGDRVSVFFAFDGPIPDDLSAFVRLNGCDPLKAVAEPPENWLVGMRGNTPSVKLKDKSPHRFVPSEAKVSWRCEFPSAAVRRGLNAIAILPYFNCAARVMCCEMEVDPK